MEIKILCSCGTKYKFDVEPITGLLPAPVKCPVCSADKTTNGHELTRMRMAASGIMLVPRQFQWANSCPNAQCPSTNDQDPKRPVCAPRTLQQRGPIRTGTSL